jgi:DNA-directed RNA polymerase specialized sigma24 family protein
VIAHEWRARRRERAEQPFEEDMIEELADQTADPEAHLDARAWVERVAGDLDGEGLRLLYRRYVLQESGKELADDLASTPAAMRMRLMRLRSSLSALVPTTPDAVAVAFATLASAASELSTLRF